MANRVNPPKQLVLPDKIASDPDLKKAFDDRDFILFQLWKRTGAGADFIDDSKSSLTEFETGFEPDAVEQVKDDVVVTSVDYTTIGNQTIVCDDQITISLNAEPEDRELVKVHTRNGRVDIIPIGKKINKEDDAIIRRDFTTWNILYVIELDEWVII